MKLRPVMVDDEPYGREFFRLSVDFEALNREAWLFQTEKYGLKILSVALNALCNHGFTAGLQDTRSEIALVTMKNGIGTACNIHVADVFDMNAERAAVQAENYQVRQYTSMQEMLADSEAEIILNITPPLAHYDTTLQCIQAGKHGYVEKPIALTYKDASALRYEAAQRGLFLCAAPDTFMRAVL